VRKPGAPWQDLPRRYGKTKTVSSRYYRWRKKGIWQCILAELQTQAEREGELDWTLHFVDNTVIRAHQHAAGAKKGTQSKKPLVARRAASLPS